jgi:putative heme-binding domain-containing protein
VLPAVLSALAVNDDPFIDHALAHVLYRHATTNDLLAALDHGDPRVQRAALVLLDQAPHDVLPAQMAVLRLTAANSSLRSAARRAVLRHPDWVAYVLPVIKRILAGTPSASDLEMLTESVAAFHKDRDLANLVGRALSGLQEASAEPIQMALLAGIARLSPSALPKTWISALEHVLRGSSRLSQAEAVRVTQILQITNLDETLTMLAEDRQAPAALRVEALRTFVHRHPHLSPGAFELLAGRLEATQPAASRLGAAEVFSSAELNGFQLAGLLRLVRDEPLLSSRFAIGLARRSAEATLAADELVAFLRVRIETGAQMDPAELAWVETVVPATNRSVVAALAQRASGAGARQMAQVSEFESLLRDGDPNRGQELFRGKTGCVACHRVGQQGGLVGPDLTKIGAIRSGRDLIESIVLPSATFAQGYEPYRVWLKDGEILTGIRVRSVDETFVLRDAAGTDVRLPTERIARVESGTVSVMPEALLSALNRAEIRDLLAYLQGLK